mmetsp:Transcript_30078/g.52831  ORF Transcript_30078/g.52831 Transcript_30078/m.52831 type:complete len:274 (-) Transcript_30078:214-1035(-)
MMLERDALILDTDLETLLALLLSLLYFPSADLPPSRPGMWSGMTIFSGASTHENKPPPLIASLMEICRLAISCLWRKNLISAGDKTDVAIASLLFHILLQSGPKTSRIGRLTSMISTRESLLSVFPFIFPSCIFDRRRSQSLSEGIVSRISFHSWTFRAVAMPQFLNLRWTLSFSSWKLSWSCRTSRTTCFNASDKFPGFPSSTCKTSPVARLKYIIPVIFKFSWSLKVFRAISSAISEKISPWVGPSLFSVISSSSGVRTRHDFDVTRTVLI